jgi:hypothetical protein
MKKYFLIIAILAFTFTGAQEFNFPGLQKRFKNPKADILPMPEIHNFNPSDQSLPFTKRSYTLPNGNKVNILPQDNMPCVMPDISQFSMPVVKPNIQHYNIPNPALPSWKKPRILTDEQWKKLLEKQKKLQ